MASYYFQAKGGHLVSEGFVPMLIPSLANLSKIICKYTWSPITYHNQYRHSKNFERSFFCVFDVDNKDEEPYSLEQAIEDFADCEVLIATTRSHQRQKGTSPPNDRFRIVIPWEEPIDDLKTYVHTMKRWAELRPYVDSSCTDGARLYYPCEEIVLLNTEGWRQSSFVAKDECPTPMGAVPPNRLRGIPYHIKRFLDKGVVFAEGRQRSCYLAALHLFESGMTKDQVLTLIKKAPFDRTGYFDWEILRAVESAYKKKGG